MVKIEFAPINIPLNRRMQTAAVLYWVFTFLFLAQCCMGVYVLAVLSGYWHFAALYGLWLYLDWDTPQTGGRRCAWVRKWTIWRHFRDYFPIHLIKTSDLDPKNHYLLGFHPHGVLVAGAFGNFCTEYTGFQELFPGLTPYLHVLPFWFRFPFLREYAMSTGLVSCSKESVSHVLSQGAGVVSVIVIGGAEESLEARPGSLTLQTLHRKGFIKLALKHGAHLVPVFSFGENEIFNQLENPEGSVVRNIQNTLRKIMGFALPLFHARGVFQYSFGVMPFRKPIYTIVGKPIVVEQNASPTTEEVDKLHQRYLDELNGLFEEHKAQYGIPEQGHLVFK